MKKDLTKVEGTYSNLIAENIETIKNVYVTKNADELRAFVLGVIAPAKDTPAKRSFILNLTKKRKKDDIIMYVYDAQLCGEGLGVNSNGKSYK